jgi:hypothetical protein
MDTKHVTQNLELTQQELVWRLSLPPPHYLVPVPPLSHPPGQNQ